MRSSTVRFMTTLCPITEQTEGADNVNSITRKKIATSYDGCALKTDAAPPLLTTSSSDSGDDRDTTDAASSLPEQDCDHEAHDDVVTMSDRKQTVRLVVFEVGAVLALNPISLRRTSEFDRKMLFFSAVMVASVPCIWLLARTVVYLRDKVDGRCAHNGDATTEAGKNAVRSILSLLPVAALCLLLPQNAITFVTDRRVLFFSVVMLISLPLIWSVAHVTVYLHGEGDCSTRTVEHCSKHKRKPVVVPTPPTASTTTVQPGAAVQEKIRTSKSSSRRHYNRRNNSRNTIGAEANGKAGGGVSPVSVCDLFM